MTHLRTNTVVKSRYVRPGSSRTTPAAFRGRAGSGARRQISAALRYVETRELGPEERPEDRALFTARRDNAARREAREKLAQRVTPAVAYHSLVLSPGPVGDGLSAEQMRAWTRRVMADLEQRWGAQVTWYGTVHQHTSHIHVHVIVAASHLRADGAWRWTRLTRADFAVLRESGDRWAEQERLSGRLLQVAECYAAEVLCLAISGWQGGAGRRPTDRDEIERSLHRQR